MQHQRNSARFNGKFRGFARIGLLMLFLLLVSAVVIPTSAQETTPVVPPQVGLRPDAPTYALHGPYWVGTQDFVIDPEADEPQEITVWYPALNPDGIAEEIIYPAALKFEVPEGTIGTVHGHALKDAAFDMVAAPYPLVIFSPGFGAGAHQLRSLNRTHGFVWFCGDRT
ncbi:MAG: hypothetical protein IPK19_08835 [Chloroflexi bacterium]|nr:hypothetical protein [Chloroflexota bacterium]